MIDSTSNINWLKAEWPVPKHINAGTTVRTGGFSTSPYTSLNIANHVGDDTKNVALNRNVLIKNLALKSEPVWLNQTHSTNITCIDNLPESPNADAVICKKPNRVCVIMTADCVPILICDKAGTKIAAIHAGWRGISRGIIESVINTYPDDCSLFVWIGPCISKQHYEVGNDVYAACLAHSNSLESGFEQKNNDHWYCDLVGLVKIILKNAGVGAIYECGLCTYEREDLFYSYRRDGVTGRTASMIWME